jgi:hypothetical protein
VSKVVKSVDRFTQLKKTNASIYKKLDTYLLNKSYENSKIGCRIGTITINAVACADDIALVSEFSVFDSI